MLKKIPANVSPDLMHALMSMGHGDEIVFADGEILEGFFFSSEMWVCKGNFPAASVAQRLIRADGLGMIDLLQSVLQFFPLDKVSFSIHFHLLLPHVF